MRIKRIVKKYFMISLGFVFLSIFSSMVISPMIDSVILSIESSKLFTKDEKFLGFSPIDQSYQKNFFNEIKEHKGFITQVFLKGEDIKLSGVYFNVEPVNEISLKEGRFFKVSDFERVNNFVLIGEGLENRVSEENKINFKGTEYEVIGIIDGGKSKGIYNETLMMDINNLITYEDMKIESSFKIDYLNGNLESKVKSIEAKLREQYPNVYMTLNNKTEFSNPLIEELNKNKFFIIMFITLFIIIISSVVNVLNYYLEEEKRNIGIKRALGASKGKIITKVFLEVESAILFSSVIGMGVFLILNSTSYFEWIDVYNRTGYSIATTFILVFILCILSGVFLLSVIIKKIFNLEINSVIRGN